MGLLLRDRILLLQFLCTTGALGPVIVSVQGGVRDMTLLDPDDSGSHIS
jgi:hypothetical protein